MTKKNKSLKKADAKRSTIKRTSLLILGSTVLTIIVVYLFVVAMIHKRHGLEDVFKSLEKEEYIVNSCFSGMYQPGSIIQVTELVDGMEKPLASPLLAISKNTCFPGKEPFTEPFTLPQYSGNFSASLKVDAKTVADILPELGVGSKTVASYSLQIGATYTVYFEKLNLSRNLSDQCVEKLQNALSDGDQLNWFKVINEAVIADSLSFEINWKSGTSLEDRKSIKKIAIQNISQMAPKNSKKSQTIDVNAGIQVETDKKMVIKAKGPVILAYKVRPLDIARGYNTTAMTEKNRDKSKQNTSIEKIDIQSGHSVIVKITVQLIQKNIPRLVNFDYPFEKGDKFRFKMTPEQNGSIYVFHHKPGSNLELLWPRSENLITIPKENRVQVGIPIEIPAAPANFFFDNQLTDELFFVALASKQDIKRKLENFSVRGKTGLEFETQRVGYTPRQDLQDPHLYFSELLKNSKGLAVVEFRLGR